LGFSSSEEQLAITSKDDRGAGLPVLGFRVRVQGNFRV